MILTGKCKEKFLEWNEEQDAPISTYAIEQGYESFEHLIIKIVF